MKRFFLDLHFSPTGATPLLPERISYIQCIGCFEKSKKVQWRTQLNWSDSSGSADKYSLNELVINSHEEVEGQGAQSRFPTKTNETKNYFLISDSLIWCWCKEGHNFVQMGIKNSYWEKARRHCLISVWIDELYLWHKCEKRLERAHHDTTFVIKHSSGKETIHGTLEWSTRVFVNSNVIMLTATMGQMINAHLKHMQWNTPV